MYDSSNETTVKQETLVTDLVNDIENERWGS